MRKLVNEEVAKEVCEKGVHIAIRMTKPTIKALMTGLEIVVGKSTKAVKEKIHPTKGKQSVKTLIRQGQGVSSIPLADDGLKDFQKIAKKYGVDFAIVKDKNVNPPVYTVFFKAKDTDAITRILQDYTAKQVKRNAHQARPSVLEKLKKFKDIVASIPKKVLEKKKEKVR